MELINNDLEINREFNKIKNIIMPNTPNKFIGGLPITLEQNNLFKIISTSVNEYTVTQKADGYRFLLFSYTVNNKSHIIFISRSNDRNKKKSQTNMYRLLNTNLQGNTTTIPQVLIDGELLIYNELGRKLDLSNISYAKYVNFIAFDILYGPQNINIKQNRINYSTEINLTKMSYKYRHDILSDLLNIHNGNLLQKFFCDLISSNLNLIVEVKPYYLINDFIQIITPNNNDNQIMSLLLSKLKDSRKKFIEEHEQFRKNYKNEVKAFINHNQHKKFINDNLLNIQIDGLIFTPLEQEYVCGGSWINFMNVQYKWKPMNEQSIDVKLINYNSQSTLTSENFVIMNEQAVEVHIPDIVNQIKTINKVDIIISNPSGDTLNNNSIYELKFDSLTESDRNNVLSFKIDKERTDKTTPNSLITAISVIKAILNPVYLKDFKILLDSKNKDFNKTFKKIQNSLSFDVKLLMHLYCTQNKLLSNKVSMANNVIIDKIFPLPQLQTPVSGLKSYIINNLRKCNSNIQYEFEIRLGAIVTNNFIPNIEEKKYNNFMKIFIKLFNNQKKFYKYKTYRSSYSETAKSAEDTSSEDSRVVDRVRKLFLPSFNEYIFLKKIKKIKYLNDSQIDIKSINNIGYDLRLSLSEEIEEKDQSLEELENFCEKNNHITQERTKFNYLNYFNIDFTKTIIKSQNIEYSIEIEYINNSISDKEMEEKYNQFINFILHIMFLVNYY